MTDHVRQLHFESRSDASAAVAERMASSLRRRIAAHGGSSLVVSGGTSPVECFRRLARQALDWRRVCVVLSDERWVEPNSEDSNERLVRQNLLTDAAAHAELLPVFAPDLEPNERCAQLDAQLRAIRLPFACCLLGMGADGHFASLFPDADDLPEGLDLDSETLWLPITTASSPHPRISMTLAALTRADEILLLIFGDEKRRVLQEALADDATYPVSRLLYQDRVSVRVYWAS